MEDNKKNAHEHNEYNGCNVVKGDVIGSVLALPGSNVTFTYNNATSKPTAKEKVVTENCEKRREVVMESVVKHFNFAENMLGNANGNKITNDQVIGLFKQCFGIGSNPKSEWKEIIEQVWGLLIDKRKLCSKEEGEDFFRPTVLNVLGYFRQKGVLKGETKELMKAVFEDAKDGQAKNLIRGEYHPEKVNQETYPLPLKFIEVMDYYIDNIMGKR